MDAKAARAAADNVAGLRNVAKELESVYTSIRTAANNGGYYLYWGGLLSNNAIQKLRSDGYKVDESSGLPIFYAISW